MSDSNKMESTKELLDYEVYHLYTAPSLLADAVGKNAIAKLALQLAVALETNTDADCSHVTCGDQWDIDTVFSRAWSLYEKQSTFWADYPLRFKIGFGKDLTRIKGIVAMARTMSPRQRVVVREISAETALSQTEIYKWVQDNLKKCNPLLETLWIEDLQNNFANPDAQPTDDPLLRFNFSRALQMMNAMYLAPYEAHASNVVNVSMSLKGFRSFQLTIPMFNDKTNDILTITMTVKEIIRKLLSCSYKQSKELAAKNKLREKKRQDNIIAMLTERLKECMEPGETIMIRGHEIVNDLTTFREQIPIDTHRTPIIAGSLFWGLWKINDRGWYSFHPEYQVSHGGTIHK